MTASPTALFAEGSGAVPSKEDVARALCIADGKDPDFDYDPLGLGRPAGTDLRWRCYLSQARAVLALFAPILAEKERRIRELVLLLDKHFGTPCEQIRHRQQIYEERETNALVLSCWQDAARALEAERDALKARALAAEAALAAAHDAYQQAAVDAVALFQAAEARALAAEAALAAERERFEAMVRAYEARSLEDERSRLEAAAPLSARETARYLEIDQKLAGLNAAAIRAQGE